MRGNVDLVYRALRELREMRVIALSDLNHSRRIVDSEIVIERDAKVERAAA